VAAGALKAGRHVECFETERSGRRRQTDDLTAEAEGRRRTKHAPKARHQLLTIAPGVAGVKRRPVSPGTATAQAPANQSQRAQGSCSSTFLTDSFFWDASRMGRHGKHDSHVRCPDSSNAGCIAARERLGRRRSDAEERKGRRFLKPPAFQNVGSANTDGSTLCTSG